MEAAWIQCGFDLAGRRVGVAVRRLDPDEHQRMAAEIAWYANGLLAIETSSRRPGWPSVLERILTSEVAITIDETLFESHDGVWDELICRAFEVFVTANCLDASIRRHLDSARSPASA